MDKTSQTDSPTKEQKVLSIECLRGSSKADEWKVDMLQTGDIVEEIRIGTKSKSQIRFNSPFKGGKSGIQKILQEAYKKKETSIMIRVRRGSDELAELQACIVPNELTGKKQFVLRSIDDPNYVVGFLDRTEVECFEIQASRSSRMVNALTKTKLQDGYVSYPWERRMQEMLPVPNSSNFLSILLLPKASDRVASRYNDLEDTLARANAWINAGSLSDLSNLANASLYGFEDYHGIDIGVVRAIRLWYAPVGGELSIEIKLKEEDSKLGFAISRTEEGFIFISSVINQENVPSTRSGLSSLYKLATDTCRLLVVSRVSNQKVLPWMVSSTGAIRCYDTVSLSQKLSLHRHTRVPILLHVFLWDRSLVNSSGGSNRFRALSPSVLQPLSSEVQIGRFSNETHTLPLPPEASDSTDITSEVSQSRLERDTAGESSFRFHDFSLSSNWV
ncbi:hypothetical protein TSUD_109690 [Trifolium subterraneum]|uniref:Uncharacterized protein n=1 Tax=Trifolium subterraneum TaxID=3900 RepID=A0A2Z6M5X1_TRISU|nr:hypothetical protein TSUD_109690 [Trifolium subterraneum]